MKRASFPATYRQSKYVWIQRSLRSSYFSSRVSLTLPRTRWQKDEKHAAENAVSQVRDEWSKRMDQAHRQRAALCMRTYLALQIPKSDSREKYTFLYSQETGGRRMPSPSPRKGRRDRRQCVTGSVFFTAIARLTNEKKKGTEGEWSSSQGSKKNS